MTCSELIEKLKKFPPDLDVCVAPRGYESEEDPVHEPEIQTQYKYDEEALEVREVWL